MLCHRFYSEDPPVGYLEATIDGVTFRQPVYPNGECGVKRKAYGPALGPVQKCSARDNPASMIGTPKIVPHTGLLILL